MRRLVLAAAALALLAVPGVASAKPGKVDRQRAADSCHAQRDALGAELFRDTYGRKAFRNCRRAELRAAKADLREARRDCREARRADRDAFEEEFGTNSGPGNAVRRCARDTVSTVAAEADVDVVEAALACKAEHEADADAFAAEYGKGKRPERNAFARCVAQTLGGDGDEADGDPSGGNAAGNPAISCMTERAELGPNAFAEKYGTNRNKRNAFGKCVDSKSEDVEVEDEDDPEDE